jgi:hypothetical protein
LKTAYPPKFKWIVESEAIYDRWAYYIEEGPQPDKREKRHPILMLNPAELQLDIGPNSNAIIHDKNTKELVMVVIRNFLGNSGLLSFLGGVIKANIDHRKNMRVCIIFKPFILPYSLHFSQLADPGSIVQVGVSAGARSNPSFGWVRNIRSKELSGKLVDELDRKTAHAFSLLWMLIRRRLPDEVSDDLVTWLAESGIYRMNKEAVKHLREQSDVGEIELEIDEHTFNFQWAELAPPSGVMAVNYSR